MGGRDAIVMKDLWKVLLERDPPPVLLYEDNQAAAEIMQSGRFPTLRHAQRTHGIIVSWLAEQTRKGIFKVAGCHTEDGGGHVHQIPRQQR